MAAQQRLLTTVYGSPRVAIHSFVVEHSQRLEVLPTKIGSLTLADLRRSAPECVTSALPKDIGELSITNFVMALHTANAALQWD